MACVIRGSLKPYLPALVLAALIAVPGGAAAQRKPSPASVIKQLNARAAKGELTSQEAVTRLQQAGVKDEELNDILKDIDAKIEKFGAGKKKQEEDAKAKKEADEKAKKEQDAKDKAKDQNASGQGDWNLGGVFRDRDYDLAMPLTNDCKVPQEVTITYPGAFNLQGPATVLVPAKTTIDVAMKLIMTQPPPPQPPFPPGLTPDCYDLAGDLNLKHPRLVQEFVTPKGKTTYVCEEMERTYKMTMHVHMHAPPDPNEGGGGGGGKKKNTTCTTYWNTGEFFPTKENPTPETCDQEVEAEALEYFNDLLPPLREKNPEAFDWIPENAEMTVLGRAGWVKLKKRADDVPTWSFEKPVTAAPGLKGLPANAEQTALGAEGWRQLMARAEEARARAEEAAAHPGIPANAEQTALGAEGWRQLMARAQEAKAKAQEDAQAADIPANAEMTVLGVEGWRRLKARADAVARRVQ